MANTTVQNCQRGIIFITFLLALLFFIVTVISLIKKLIDSSAEEGEGQQRYKEGQQKQASNYEHSAEKFDHAAMDATEIKQDDTNLVKFLKKMKQLETRYFPLFVAVPLNILTGTSKAFSFVFFFFMLIVVLLINVARLHRKCFEHKCVIVLLENLWIAMMIFEFINVWGASTIYQPYIVVAG